MNGGDAFVLRGGLVVDGTGRDASPADVHVRAGRIARVTQVGEAADADADVIDCIGMLVSPGFIDLHTHSDLTLLRYPGAHTRIVQGVTTEVTGNCGMSPFPVTVPPEEGRAIIGPLDVSPDLTWSWTTEQDYLALLREASPAVNVAPLVGHGSLRQWRNGAGSRLEPGALDGMRRHLAQLLDRGVWGLSLGLMYAPGEAADAEELVALAEVVREADALMSVHLRSYDAADIAASLGEVLDIADRTGVRLQVSHLRTIGDQDAVAMRGALGLVEARQSVGADAYPYLAGHTTLLQLLEPATRERGVAAALALMRSDPDEVARQIRGNGIGAEAITIAKSADPAYVGQTLAEIARREERDWGAVAVSLLVSSEGSVDIIAIGSEWSDTMLSLSHPDTAIASDGVSLDLGHDANLPHPRSIGTFPAALRRLVDSGMRWEEAIRKATSLPARRVGLRDRGAIAAGNAADLVVLVPDELDDRSDYLHPLRPPSGVRDVFVNGQAAVRRSRLTGVRAGMLLLRGRCA